MSASSDEKSDAFDFGLEVGLEKGARRERARIRRAIRRMYEDGDPGYDDVLAAIVPKKKKP